MGERIEAGVLDVKPPQLDAQAASQLVTEQFGLAVEDLSPLESERDLNFRLRANGREWVLKIANPAEPPEVLDFQLRALAHIAARDPELPVPRALTTRSGGATAQIVGSDGRPSRVRVLSFLPGTLLAGVEHEPGLLRNVGVTLARLGRALRGFFHPAAGHELLWDLKHAARLLERVGEIADPARRELAERWLRRFEARVLPALPGLRAQVIHNDVSGNNTLVDPQRQRVSGIIDFGDMLHAPLINDVAVTLAETLLAGNDPIATARALLGGYCEVEPLQPEELALLCELVGARLAMGLVISAWRVGQHPENAEYISGDDPALERALAHLDEVEPELRGALLGMSGEASAASREGLQGSAPESTAADFAHANDPRNDPQSLLARRARVLPALIHFYDRPLHPLSGRGSWLVDVTGRAYLDAYNNVPHVGHCHPAVVAAIARQAATLNTNTRYLDTTVLDYAERLIASLPEPLDVCLFVCSGSEANDLAWRIAKLHTGQRGALVVAGAYHGTTDAIADLSPSELRPGEAPPSHVRVLPAPDDYRGPYRRGQPGLGERYASAADDAIASLRDDGLAPAAFFVDPLLASSGILMPPQEYLKGVFARVRAAGGLCVADEVQSGFGRTGDHFWGFEAAGVVPDLVTLGKPIGNGHPLAAVVTRSSIARSLAERGEFFSTFGGNPVSCAAGLAVLDVLEREGLRENARRVGALLRTGLETLAERHAWIGDVRGRGLFVGVELVRDRSSLEPAPQETHALLERLREDGVLVGSDGPHANVVKIRPPLVFSASDAARLLDAFDRALTGLA